MNKAQAALEFVKNIAAEVQTPEYDQIKQIRLSLRMREQAASTP